MLKEARELGVRIVLPTDAVVAGEFKADAPHQTVAANAIPADAMGLDIGPETAAAFAKIRSLRRKPYSLEWPHGSL